MSAQLAVIVFVLATTGTLFALPLLIKKFTKQEWFNLILRRACFAIAIYLMMLNTTIVMNIASDAGLGIFKELWLYVWLFGWGGRIFLTFMFIKSLFDLMDIHYLNKKKKRGLE